jgi:O-antigen ligase
VRALRRLYPLFAILVPGLIFSQSRGAILAAVVGVVVILLMQKLSSQQLLGRALPILLLAGVVFLFAPTSLRQRLTTLTPGTQSSAAYALTLRQQAWHDARAIAAAHPWTGVGIGDYGAADAAVDPNNQAQDPQDVILLQQAEGGYPLAVAFILLIGGTLVALWRMRQVELAAAAAGVIVATAAHGLVDVYWVRGTPLLGWLMLGMVCALARMRATGTATDAAT